MGAKIHTSVAVVDVLAIGVLGDVGEELRERAMYRKEKRLLGGGERKEMGWVRGG